MSPTLVAVLIAAPSIVFACLAFVSTQWQLRRTASSKQLEDAKLQILDLEKRVKACEDQRNWQSNEITSLQSERNGLLVEIATHQRSIINLQERVISLEKELKQR